MYKQKIAALEEKVAFLEDELVKLRATHASCSQAETGSVASADAEAEGLVSEEL